MSLLHWIFGKHPPRPADPTRAVGLDPIPHWQAVLVVQELASLGIRATISDHQIALSRDGKLTEGARIWVVETDVDIATRVVDEMEGANAPKFVLRRTAASDADYLVAALSEAIWLADHDLEAPEITEDEKLNAYVDSFGDRPGDVGWIAEDLDGHPIGAAWCRLFGSERPGYGFVADDVPELAMAVAPSWRNQGVGSALLVALVDSHPRISLSVHEANPAHRLYRRFGFVEVGRTGDSITMLHDHLAF